MIIEGLLEWRVKSTKCCSAIVVLGVPAIWCLTIVGIQWCWIVG